MRKFSLSLLILLALAVLAVGTGVILYLSTTPEDRHLIFWISLGTVALGVVLSTLGALINLWSDSDRALPFPSTLSLTAVTGGYTLFALGAAVAAWRFVNFSPTGYIITHVAGGTAFLLGGIFALMGGCRPPRRTGGPPGGGRGWRIWPGRWSFWRRPTRGIPPWRAASWRRRCASATP